MKKSLGAKTVATPTPTWLIGSYDAEGKPNLMTIAWGGICCSQPPCVTISLRKATYTYACIMERKAYTVGIPSVDFIKEADYCGIATGRDTNKFADLGLTAVKSDLVDAPYANELPVVIECKLLRTVEIGLHTLFIGEIIDIKADEKVLNADGLLDIQKLNPLVYNPSQSSYFSIGSMVGKAFLIGRKEKP
jgi:flavin reductase (DIM6/NTAB) family NADH-FMN oxidoreductase RutF